MMIVKSFCCGPFETNAYLVGCSSTRSAALIDPAPGSRGEFLAALEKEGLTATHILLTHTHWDHIADVPLLKKALGLPVYVHKADAANLIAPGSDGLPLFIALEGVTPDYLLEGEERIEVGQHSFEVLPTPGHTPGGVCFYCEREGLLFSGDTLFKGAIGNLSFPTASPEDMWHSLERLAALPPTTRVLPGHGVETTIGVERWLPEARKLFG